MTLGLATFDFLSNNPSKSLALSNGGIKVVAQIPCEAPPNEHSLSYLRTKKEKLGHTLTLEHRASLNDQTREARGVVSGDLVDRPSVAGRTRSTKSHEQTQRSLLNELV